MRPPYDAITADFLLTFDEAVELLRAGVSPGPDGPHTEEEWAADVRAFLARIDR